MQQQTVGKSVRFQDIEPFGGCRVDVSIRPSEKNSGICFHTRQGKVPATLTHAVPSRRSLLLQKGKASVFVPEHILATLYAYDIDNADIVVQRVPSRSFSFLERIHLATPSEVLPNPIERQYEVCRQLDGAGVEVQDAERNILHLMRPYSNGRIQISHEKGLFISTTTDYSPIGEQTYGTFITPQLYREGLARARPYASHRFPLVPKPLASAIAACVFPRFGIGHGYHDRFFWPCKTEEGWETQEHYPAEIARHSIVDKLGALSLLPGRLQNAHMHAQFSGHKHDLQTLHTLIHEGYVHS